MSKLRALAMHRGSDVVLGSINLEALACIITRSIGRICGKDVAVVEMSNAAKDGKIFKEPHNLKVIYNRNVQIRHWPTSGYATG